MELLAQIVALPFEIPVWQLSGYLILVSFFVATRRTALCLGLTYLVALYWLYLLFQPFFSVGPEGSFLAVAIYILLALVVTGGLAYAYFGDMAGPRVAGFSKMEVLNLRSALLKRVDKLESALLKSAESKLEGEMQRFEELRQQLEARVSKLPLETPELDWSGGTLPDGREQGFQLKLRELENQLQEKDELLRRIQETADRESDSQMVTAPVDEELQEKNQAIERLQSKLQDREEKFGAQVQELEAEIARLKGQLERRLREEEEEEVKSENTKTGQPRDRVLAGAVFPWESAFDLGEEKEAVMEARLQRLWNELMESGILIQEREMEVQIIQQWMQ